MIYFDNAATSLQKPAIAPAAAAAAMCALGNPGRGAYEPALQAARTVYSTRLLLAELFSAPSAASIAFTYNATYALNMALFGLLQPGEHVLTTVCEHNSVLRPLYALARQGVQVTHLPCDGRGRLDYDSFAKNLRSNTRAVVLSHASNVTGNIVDMEWIGRFTREHGLVLVADAAQTAGCCPIDVQQMGIDILCFTGHKGLLGPQGTGGLYVRPGLRLRSLLSGGSGVQSFAQEQPSAMPAALEAGTLNVQGLAGLRAALLARRDEPQTRPQQALMHENMLAERLLQGIREFPGISLYGDYRPGSRRMGIVSLNLGQEDAGRVSSLLWERWGICTRAGAHCAPLLHRALGTERRGAVRFSFGPYNTETEVDTAIAALRELAEK